MDLSNVSRLCLSNKYNINVVNKTSSLFSGLVFLYFNKKIMWICGVITRNIV